jgi:hypothetical protein
MTAIELPVEPVEVPAPWSPDRCRFVETGVIEDCQCNEGDW